MIADILNKRTPLYEIQANLRDIDVVTLFGEGVTPDMFNDDRLSRCLDLLSGTGLRNLYSKVALRALTHEQAEINIVHGDTTSLSVYGKYDGYPDKDLAIISIDFGHSKDHRPDLKQFKLGVVVNSEGIPIYAEVLDGNASDKTWSKDILGRLDDLNKLWRSSNLMFVADSAMVSGPCLDVIAAKDIKFISRCSENFAVCNELMQRAWSDNEWVELGTFSESKQASQYKGIQYISKIDGRDYRFEVIHSTFNNGQLNRDINKKLDKEKKRIIVKAEKLGKETYFCEPDAISAKDAFMKEHSNTIFRLSYSIETFVVPIKRPKRGRPSKNDECKYERRYSLVIRVDDPTDEAIKRLQELESTFVLITNEFDESEFPMARLLQEYKGQTEVEQQFGFIKDEHFVQGVFLHKPNRVAALGIVFMLAGMVAAIMERRVRKSIELTQTPMKSVRRNGKVIVKPTVGLIIDELKEAVGITIIRYDNGDRETIWHTRNYSASKPIGQLLQHLGIAVNQLHERPPIVTVFE